MNNRTRTLSQCRTALPRHIAMMESLEERQFLSAASAHQGWGSHRFNTLKTTAQVTTSSDLGTASSLTTADTPVGATIAAPAAPSNFQAIAINGQQVSLSWSDNANNETSFKIERARGTAGSWTQIAIVGSNITFYTDSGLSAATLYQYRICASNVAGSSAYSPSVTTTTSNSVPPAAPTNPMTIAATTSTLIAAISTRLVESRKHNPNNLGRSTIETPI